MTPTVHHGDCLEVLRSLPDASVDAVVTDPPYALSFMGKAWDSHDTPIGFQAWCQLWATECLRVLKPGGHMLAFGGTRTWHRLACAVEDAGFEVRDSIAWMYGSGFPKSLDVSKAIDKAAGVDRDVIGQRDTFTGADKGANTFMASPRLMNITAPATDAARTWQGWGTALKPAFEPIVVARKPLVGTVAGNVLAHGTGALNIDGCRVAASGRPPIESKSEASVSTFGDGLNGSRHAGATDLGRWPANVILDEDQANALDQQSGDFAGVAGGKRQVEGRVTFTVGEEINPKRFEGGVKDFGGASRFFYVAQDDTTATPSQEWRPCWRGECQRACYYPETCTEGSWEDVAAAPLDLMEERFRYSPKAPKKERPIVDGTAHPTVKPLALMRWLVRLVTPPGGTVLEPFAGSGTTVEACILEGFNVIAIEREADYLPLIQSRIFRAQAAVAVEPEPDLFSDLDGEAS